MSNARLPFRSVVHTKNSALAEEGQQLLQHPLRTLLGNPMAATFSDTPRTSLTTRRHDSIAAMPRPRPRASKAKDRHGELAAFAQERLVVGDVLRRRPVEIETRPHGARQSVGSENIPAALPPIWHRPAAPIAIEEAKVKLLTPKYERLWEIELPVQSMMPAVGNMTGLPSPGTGTSRTFTSPSFRHRRTATSR